jgi:hypothetical protein
MLSTSQKHQLLLEFNNKRKAKYEKYMIGDNGGEEQKFRSTMEAPISKTMALDERTDLLYKRLGNEHYNKDV